MLNHLAAIRQPVMEYREGLGFVLHALVQPVAPFAALGGFSVLRQRAAERLLFPIYCFAAWIVAVITLPQVGSNINYF